MLARLSQAGSVEVDGGNLVVFPNDKPGLFNAVNDLIQQKQWQVRELHVGRGRLDEVFRTITQGAA